MNNIYFSVVDNGDVLVARVIAPGRQGEKTVILKRIMDLARSMNGDDLKVIMQEFPEDSRTIKAVYVLIACYKVVEVSGIHWSSADGHSIHIEFK